MPDMSNNEFPREVAASVRRMARHFPVVVVTGARQTGKTTLLTKLFGDYNYVSLDLPAEAQLAEEDPQSFLSRHPAPLLVDEVQYAPKLFRYLKVEIDRCRDINGRFILAGSQKFSLMQGVSESLAGRCGVLELEGLTIEELGPVFYRGFGEDDEGSGPGPETPGAGSNATEHLDVKTL